MLKTMLKIGPVCMQLLYNVHATENLAVLKKHVENFSAKSVMHVENYVESMLKRHI